MLKLLEGALNSTYLHVSTCRSFGEAGGIAAGRSLGLSRLRPRGVGSAGPAHVEYTQKDISTIMLLEYPYHVGLHYQGFFYGISLS